MIYKTVSGDTWDMIALKVYGHIKYTNELIKANTNLIKSVIFESGVNINIPEIDTSPSNNKMPPWKRGH
ncbi:MAG: tail protein X [Vallitalea sp.]|jgi:phage tail protein X|nr:tail protein X [Vallitalea sp.]